MTRKKASSSYMERMRGSTRDPLNPSGRLVIELTGKANSNTMQLTHWCPDANKTGIYSWKCSECGRWFAWSVDRQQWETVDDPESG